MNREEYIKKHMDLKAYEDGLIREGIERLRIGRKIRNVVRQNADCVYFKNGAEVSKEAFFENLNNSEAAYFNDFGYRMNVGLDQYRFFWKNNLTIEEAYEMLKASYAGNDEALFLLSQADPVEEYNDEFRCRLWDDDRFGDNPAYPIPGQWQYGDINEFHGDPKNTED